MKAITAEGRINHIQAAQKADTKPYTLIIMPAILISILFLIPFVWGIYLTFTDFRLGSQAAQFNWFQNYRVVLSSRSFWGAALKTLQFSVFAVGLEFAVGTVLAMLMNTETFMARLMRRVISFSLMIAPIIATIALKLMLNNRFGIVNYVLSFFGRQDFPWGASPKTAMFTVILADIWIFTPFIVLILLAGLRSLPRDPLEAAQVDGATNVSIFTEIMLPMLLPTMLIAIIFRFIDCVKAFDVIWGMTAGGPGDATMNLSIHGYVMSFSALDIAKGTTVLVFVWLLNMFLGTKLLGFWKEARARLGG